VTSPRCVIPEVPYDLDALAPCSRPTTPRTATTPSSCGRARSEGTQMTDVGSADAFGHRHKANVGRHWRSSCERTGIRPSPRATRPPQRQPGWLDALVTTFANIAMDLVNQASRGR
jgi:hypothetical protein